MDEIRLTITSSTNDDARQRFRGVPLVVVAAEQTHGVGRMGRTWHSPRGGLWLTLAWPPRLPLAAYQALSLVAGLATADAIENTCRLDARIKWPNDLLVERGGVWRKLCGILCQSDATRSLILIGIGINANFPASELGEGLRLPPTTLHDELGHDIDLVELEQNLITTLHSALVAYEEGHWPARLLPAVRTRLCWTGLEVHCADAMGTNTAVGVLQGIDDSGRLLIESGHKLQALVGGEVSIANG